MSTTTPEVHYRVSMEAPETHCFGVRMTISALAARAPQGKLSLSMPVWTPGSYLIRDFPRDVLAIAVTGHGGEELPVDRQSKTTWVVTAGEADSLTVDYLVYAFDFTVDTSYIDTEHAIINGASLFMYAQGFEDAPITLQLVPFHEWKVVSTGLEKVGPNGWTFKAPNYDILVDSPVEVGNQHVHHFEAAERRHEVSIFAKKPIDEERLVTDIKKIVESAIPIFADVPYKRYVFLTDFTADGHGGLEHLNSTHCIGSYFWLEPPEEYRSFMTLFSHEFFHTWNVKRMRPVALGPFDYTKENYTKSLWISEGITSYYENIIMRRAGIFSVPELLEELAFSINYVKSLPSARVQTPEESSFDSWIRLYKQDENSPNVSPSYYRQGAVIGLLLDLAIRSATDSARSLDDAMRDLYRETYQVSSRGFTDEEFEEACAKVSEGKTREIFRDHVHGRKEIDYNRYLSHAGLQLTAKSVPSPDDGFLGIRVRGAPALVVATRLTGSPAEAADLSAGDEIIATDGLRTDSQKLAFYVANRKPGTQIELTIARGGVLKNISVRLAPKPVFEHRITKKESASAQEKRTFASWAIENWDEPLVYKEHRASPLAPKNLDYL